MLSQQILQIEDVIDTFFPLCNILAFELFNVYHVELGRILPFSKFSHYHTLILMLVVVTFTQVANVWGGIISEFFILCYTETRYLSNLDLSVFRILMKLY